MLTLFASFHRQPISVLLQNDTMWRAPKSKNLCLLSVIWTVVRNLIIYKTPKVWRKKRTISKIGHSKNQRLQNIGLRDSTSQKSWGSLKDSVSKQGIIAEIKHTYSNEVRLSLFSFQSLFTLRNWRSFNWSMASSVFFT